MNSSTPTYRNRERCEDEAVVQDHTAELLEFNATLRFPPHDPFRLRSRAKTRDYASLDAVAQQIAAARTRPYFTASQASLFNILRLLQLDFPAGLARREPASHAGFQPNFPMSVYPQSCRASSAYMPSLVRVLFDSARRPNPPQSTNRSFRPTRTRRCLRRFRSKAPRFQRRRPSRRSLRHWLQH